ncbi:MAG: efflux RND transporter periplasmic adaptor subunit [Candidatus Zixiibacteriota bacterium]
MKKALIWIVVIVIIALIGYRGYKAYQKSQTKEVFVEEKTKPVEIQVVKATPFKRSLSFTGDVKGIEEIDVFPKVSGKLVKIKVREGDRVKKDQVLALVDRDIAGMKFELAEVTSPVEGIIGWVFLDEGSGVSPPSPSPQMGTPIFRVVNMDQVKVVINVIEKDLPKIKMGQTAEISSDAYPDRSFSGKVSLISPVVDQLTRSAGVEIILSNPGHLLKPGMYAQVSITTEKTKEALLINSYSILEKGDQRAVFVVRDQKAYLESVETGDFGSDLIEIKAGLTPGETLVVSGHNRLSHGDSVRIVGGIK